MTKTHGLALVAACFLMGCAHHGKGKHHMKHGQKRIEKWNLMDKNGDGKVTKAEFTAGKMEKFNAMDTDKNGSVSSSEMMAHKAGKKKKCDRCQ